MDRMQRKKKVHKPKRSLYSVKVGESQSSSAEGASSSMGTQ